MFVVIRSHRQRYSTLGRGKMAPRAENIELGGLMELEGGSWRRQKFNAGPEQCPLLTQSGHAELHRGHARFGGKVDIHFRAANVRF